MKLASYFPVLALGFLLAARMTSGAAFANGAKLLPISSHGSSGAGYGTFTTLGWFEGAVFAHLYDQAGTRCYTLKGSVVSVIDCCGQGLPPQGNFYGALIAPGEIGEMLPVEGTCTISSAGAGQLAAVVFAVGERGGLGAKIGRIHGVFQLPEDREPSLEELLLASSVTGLRRQRAARRPGQIPVLIVDPPPSSEGNPGDLIDPALLGIEVPLALRWMLDQ